MSGIGFQKLNGQGTSAYDLLQKTIELVEEIQKLNYPDIYKMAKMFAPNLELVAVTKNWLLDFGDGNRQLNFDGRYFGYFVLTAGTTETANSDNGYRLCQGRIYDSNETTALVMAGFHGDDILPMNSESVNYIGFGTSMYFGALKGIAKGYCNVSFIGFKLGDAVVSPPLPEEPIIVDVNNTSQKDVTANFLDVSNTPQSKGFARLTQGKIEIKKDTSVEISFGGKLQVDGVTKTLTATKYFDSSGNVVMSDAQAYQFTITNGSQTEISITTNNQTTVLPANTTLSYYAQADEIPHLTFDGNLVIEGQLYQTQANLDGLGNGAYIQIKPAKLVKLVNTQNYQLDVHWLDKDQNVLSSASSNFTEFGSNIYFGSITEYVLVSCQNEFSFDGFEDEDINAEFDGSGWALTLHRSFFRNESEFDVVYITVGIG